MNPLVDANLYDLEEATSEHLPDEIMALQREMERAEAKAARREEACREVAALLETELGKR